MNQPKDLSAGAGEQVKGIYIASRASLPERSQRWRLIRDSGIPITCSWIDEAGDGETDDFGELWMRIQTEIFGSRSLILYAESEDFPLKGALIEVGIALAVGIPVYAVLPGVELAGRTMRPVGSWLEHPQVKRVKTVEEAIALSMRGAGEQTDDTPCDSCGKPMNNGWRHNHTSGYGDFATISCSAPTEPKREAQPLPAANNEKTCDCRHPESAHELDYSYDPPRLIDCDKCACSSFVEKTKPEVWTVEVSYDADNNQYESIKGPEGEHIATVQGLKDAHRIVDAINARALLTSYVKGVELPSLDELIEAAKAWGHWSTLRETSQETIDYWKNRVETLKSGVELTSANRLKALNKWEVDANIAVERIAVYIESESECLMEIVVEETKRERGKGDQ